MAHLMEAAMVICFGISWSFVPPTVNGVVVDESKIRLIKETVHEWRITK